MCAKASEPPKKERGKYNSSLQSLLDIWDVLATYASPNKPLTAGDVAKYLERDAARRKKKEANQSYLHTDPADNTHMTAKQQAQYNAAQKGQKGVLEDPQNLPDGKKKHASTQTVDRYLPYATDIINRLFPHTVLREDGKPAILHTYTTHDTLHVVMENPSGEPLWEGEMTAILTENPLNPIPKPTLTRKLPQLMEEYYDIISTQSGSETMDTPPISVAGVVAMPKAGGQTRYIPATEWESSAKSKEKTQGQGPTRRFFLQSILSPSEWRILSDMIMVYPYISENDTIKFRSAMARIAPGVRDWKHQRYAPKTPQTINFEHIRLLDESIEKGHKVQLRYGKYQLSFGSDRRWRPALQAMEKNRGWMRVDPYAMMWSNGYYYLVCRDGEIMRNLRVDRIMEILTTTEEFEKDPTFDPYQYRDRSPVMYPGEPTRIRLKCDTNRISTLMDFFGTAISEYSVSEQKPHETTVTLKASEKGVRLFALQYADDVEVLEPASLRDEVATTLKIAASKYR